MAAACYHRVGLLIAEAGGQDGRTGLLATARDHSAPPTATATGALTAAAALRETVTELGMAIPGGGHFGVSETFRIYQAAWVCMLLAIAVDELISPVETGSHVPTFPLCSGVNACFHLAFAQQWQPPGGLAAAS